MLPDLPKELTTQRLLLRPYRTEDAGMYFRMLHANWDHLVEFLPLELYQARNEQEIEAVLRKHTEEWEQGMLYIFGVWEKTGGNYVGEAYLANGDHRVPCIEVGYFLTQANTGKGYATEATLAVIRFAFEQLKVIRVELQVRAGNEASIRVAERCGFTYEGRMRQRHRMKSGEVVDVLWYGLLREEWEKFIELKG